jgi:hypothetical protein
MVSAREIGSREGEPIPLRKLKINDFQRVLG